MMNRLHLFRAVVALSGLLLTGGARAQTTPAASAEPELRLVTGTYRLPAGAVVTEGASEAVAGRYYRLIQFDKLPTDAERAALAQGGAVELLDYLPQNAWLAAFRTGTDPVAALRGLAVRAVVVVAPEWKMSAPLSQADYPGYAQRPGNRVALRVQPYAPVPRTEAAARLRALGVEVLEQQESAEVLDVVANPGQERAIAAEPWVQYLEIAPPAPSLEAERDITNHRSNVLNNNLPGGRRFDGAGVTVAVGDDGFVGPHIDFKGRLTNIATDMTAANTHADHVTGIVGGNGNLNPTVYGNAPGSTLRVYSYYNDISTMTGATGQYTAQAVRISSHSLGQTCNGGYTSDARTSDQHTRLNSALMYVHSSGNSGADDCGYGGAAIAGWGNITGGYKMGKNVLAVGNLTYLDVLSSSSSRGPASDGRIKPDICAVGSSVNSTQPDNTYAFMSGTSMACPAVSGVLAQLYQAYRSLNAGADPNSALIKAAVLNTADDLGNAGPDFKHGYGRINALRAVEVLENTRYATNTISTGQTQTVSITVPAGASQVKVLLYWADYEAASNAATALINDLDLTLTAPGATVYQPWVLNPAANATTLDAPATRGADHLNNAEQVTLDAPAAGTYTATISGLAVPQGPQRYYVVYSWVEDNVRLTFPLGGEAFVPGETQNLRWDASTTATGFTLEYSLNGGSTWTTIGTATAAARTRTWTVPTGGTGGQTRVRITRGAQSSQSANFTIAGVPANLQTEWVCATETRLKWSAVTGATSYEVFQLGTQTMQSVGTTTALAYTVTGVASGTEHWFSVRALGANGLVGRRANALKRVTGTTGCPSQPPTAAITALAADPCPGKTVTLTDASDNNPTSWLWSAAPGPMTFVGGTSAASQHPQVQFPVVGPQVITLVASNTFGSNTVTRSITVSQGLVVTMATPFTKANFNGTWPPAGWRVQSSGGTYTWQQSAVIPGPTAGTGQFAALNNYSYNNPGAEDALVLPRLDLSALNSPQLRFYVAYAPYDAASTDALRVDLAPACTGAFAPSSFLKTGLVLGTTGGYQTGANWAPTSAAQWREEVVDLTALMTEAPGAGSEIRMVNINDFGQWLYLGGFTVEGQDVLPLTLINFQARRQTGGAVELTWETAQEVNTAAFDVERSTDARRWQVLTSVPAAGNSLERRTYSWRDAAAPATETYYRLRMRDLDGKAQYSPIRALEGAATAAAAPLQVWPVPVAGDAGLHVRAATPLTSVELTDNVGRVVRRADLASPAPELSLDVRGLPAGLYVVRARTASGGAQRATVTVR